MTAPTKTPTPKKRATEPTTKHPTPKVTARSGIANRVWTARHSPWKTSTLLASIAAVTLPVIEYATLGTFTLNPAVLAPFAAAPLTAAIDPHSRAVARVDLRNAATSARIRGRWSRWVRTDEGRSIEYPATFTRRAFLGQPRVRPRVVSVTKEPLTVVVESPGFLTQKQWDALAETIGRNLRQHPATVELDRKNRRAILTFPIDGGETLPLIPAWKAEIPETLPPLDALPVAHGPKGPFPLPLLDTHWLISGATRSGKGSVIWSIVRCLLPGVADRTIELWAIDPKGGIELGFGRALFTEFAGSVKDGIPIGDQIVDMLEHAVKTMETRLGEMEGNSRLFRPSPGNPAIVIIFDEMLAVELRMTSREQMKRAGDALRTLLTAGAAASVIVIGAAQMTQKSGAISARDGFTRRLCLRVTDPIQVDMVLGPGAYKNGARAELIRSDQQGTGFMLEEGQSTPYLVRFPWCSDDEVKRYARLYPAPARPGRVDTAPLPVTPPPPAAVPDPPAPKPSPTREAIEALLKAEWTDTREIAAAVREQGLTCSTRYVRTIIGERKKEAAEGGPEGEEPQPNHEHETPYGPLPPAPGPVSGEVSPELSSGSAGRHSRNGVPAGDPTSGVKSLSTVPIPEPPDQVYPDPLRALSETWDDPS